MDIYYDKAPGPKGGILTMGVFDGVHLGHRHLLSVCQAWAHRAGTFCEVWVFHPHPRTILRKERIPLITTLEERLALLHAIHPLVVRVISFSQELAQLSAETFITEWIQAVSAPMGMVLGYDHRFGRDRRGGADMLRAIGLPVKEVPAFQREGTPISSSAIRKLIAAGTVAVAHELLGYPFTVHGRVREGRQEARTFGVPTANIPYPSEKVRPPAGIYVGWANLVPKSPLPVSEGYPALLYLPPEGDLEVHILDAPVEPTLYDTLIGVGFLEYLRPHQSFPSSTALIAQIHADVEAARAYFSRLRNHFTK